MTFGVSDSDLEVCNAALARIGVSPIRSILDNTLPARTLNLSYLDVLEAEVSAYPWRFARAWGTLARLADDPPPGWLGLYKMPDEARAIQKVTIHGRPAQFDVYEREVAVNANADEPVVAEYTKIPVPSQWPGYFREAFILRLAAAVCMAITQDQRMTNEIEKKAEYKIRFARTRDAQGRTPSKIDTSTFIRARRRGYR